MSPEKSTNPNELVSGERRTTVFTLSCSSRGERRGISSDADPLTRQINDTVRSLARAMAVELSNDGIEAHYCEPLSVTDEVGQRIEVTSLMVDQLSGLSARVATGAEPVGRSSSFLVQPLDGSKPNAKDIPDCSAGLFLSEEHGVSSLIFTANKELIDVNGADVSEERHRQFLSVANAVLFTLDKTNVIEASVDDPDSTPPRLEV